MRRGRASPPLESASTEPPLCATKMAPVAGSAAIPVGCESCSKLPGVVALSDCAMGPGPKIKLHWPVGSIAYTRASSASPM